MQKKNDDHDNQNNCFDTDCPPSQWPPEIQMLFSRFSVEVAADEVFWMRDDSKILYVNDSACKRLGYTRKEMLQMYVWNWDPLFSEESWSGFWEDIQKKKSMLFETKHRTKAGEIFPVEISAHILEYSGKKYLFAFVKDITEQKKTEKELEVHRLHLEELVKKRTKELDAKNKELEIFTYSVSHDLKAPLRGIDGYSRLLAEEYSDRLDEEGLLFLENIRNSAAQMNQLIEDLLRYSRMERRDLQPISIDIGSVIALLISQREHELKTGNIKLSVNLPFQNITTDSETLRQVLGNYLDNAIKFLKKKEPGKIEISGRETEKSWTLWVADNGIGFDPQYHDRIFQIFQRLNRVEDYPGTGIGLAIVRKAIERIGGRIWAESNSGQGAVFFVEFFKKNKFKEAHFNKHDGPFF